MSNHDEHPTDDHVDATVVELGTGFTDDDVAVLLNGSEVWSRHGVTTNYSVGLADVVRLNAPLGVDDLLEVRVGRQTAAQQVDRQTGAGRWRVDVEPSGSLVLGPASDDPLY